METNPSNSSENGQAPNQNPQGQAPNSDGQAPNETPNQQQAPLSRADLEEIVGKLRAESADNRIKLKKYEEAARKQEADAKAALDKQLKEQGQYKELAEQHEARVQELEPVAERYGQLAELVGQQIKTQIKDWPAEVKTFDPGEDAPIEQRLAWLEKSKPLIEKLQQQARATQPGNAPNPRPSQQPAEGNNYYEKLRASGKYGA